MKGWDYVLRIGLGYDVHRLHAGRQLVLGGVIIPYPQGFQAYSDGDPVAHAIVDALLGTISPGEDIANRFPDTDPQNKNIRSLRYLERLRPVLADAQANILNMDMVIEAEKPKLKPYFLAMRQNIAEALDIRVDQVGMKGKTSEGAGYLGRGEAIACRVVALVEIKHT